MFKRLWNSRHFILKKSSSITALIYAILGFVRMFVGLDGLFNDSMSFWCRLFASVLILICVWTLCAIGTCVLVVHQKKRKMVEGRNGKGVYVMYGDLFNEEIGTEKGGRRSICFAANRCFDTIVDENLVSSATIHGNALKMLYDAQLYTPQSLDTAIHQAIPPSTRYEMLTPQQKPYGNLKRYEVGTAVDVKVTDQLHYFMVGVSAFNSELKAETSLSDYCLAIQRTIEFCDAHSQGYPVLMPIIGGFLSRTGLSEIDLLRYIIMCFSLNHDHINSDIYIVIRESAKDTISIFEL